MYIYICHNIYHMYIPIHILLSIHNYTILYIYILHSVFFAQASISTPSPFLTQGLDARHASCRDCTVQGPNHRPPPDGDHWDHRPHRAVVVPRSRRSRRQPWSFKVVDIRWPCFSQILRASSPPHIPNIPLLRGHNQNCHWTVNYNCNCNRSIYENGINWLLVTPNGWHCWSQYTTVSMRARLQGSKCAAMVVNVAPPLITSPSRPCRMAADNLVESTNTYCHRWSV